MSHPAVGEHVFALDFSSKSRFSAPMSTGRSRPRTSFSKAASISAALLPRLVGVFVLFPLCLCAGGTVTLLSQTQLEGAMAEGGDVMFAASGTLVLTNTIHVLANTTLKAGSHTVLISGGDSVRLFQVHSNVSFRTEGLVLANGRVLGANGVAGSPPFPGEPARGAAILNQGGTVTLIDCTLTNHFVRGGDAGADPSGKEGGAGGAAFGGAIWSFAGDLILTNCLLANNRAEGGKGSWAASGQGVVSGDASGGAIHLEAGKATLESVRFSSNTVAGGEAVGGGGLISGGAGKGGDSRGGALYANYAVLTISRAQVAGNRARSMVSDYETWFGTDSGSAEGGAFFIATNSVAEIRLSAFASNAALGVPGRRNEPAGRGEGGAICCQGALSVFDSSFSTNKAAGGYGRYVGSGRGGAISATSNLSISGSALLGNEARAGDFEGPTGIGEGGAIRSAGSLFITNSTLALNKTSGSRLDFYSYTAGPARGGAIAITSGSAMLVNVTVSANSAEPDPLSPPPPLPLAQGGALFVTNSQVTVRNSIFANSPVGGDVWGPVTDAGYNLASDNSAAFSAAGSLNNTDPGLTPPGSNGGPTMSMALLPGSPARDAIPAGFPAVDQCGTPRPRGPRADIGAFEAEYVPALKIACSGLSVLLTFEPEAGHTYRLLASTNLIDWTQSGATTVVGSEPILFSEPMETNGLRFFRIVEAVLRKNEN